MIKNNKLWLKKKSCSLKTFPNAYQDTDYFILLPLVLSMQDLPDHSHSTRLLRTMPTLVLSPAWEMVWFWMLSSWEKREKLMVEADEGIAACGPMSKAGAPYCLFVAEPILEPKWQPKGGFGLCSQLCCPPPVDAFQWGLWVFLQDGRGLYKISVMFGLEIRSVSHVLCWLIVAAWWWVVTALLWNFSAGRAVETTPSGFTLRGS